MIVSSFNQVHDRVGKLFSVVYLELAQIAEASYFISRWDSVSLMAVEFLYRSE